ncbi:MAG: BamA/TamA family outer membrane protein [Chlorobiaceae bacterium]|nr:BamA/TamA family outer membrane protein [Chlorobiaceae bacterium]
MSIKTECKRIAILTALLLIEALMPALLFAAPAAIVYPDTLALPGRRYAMHPFMRPARKTVGLALSGGGANCIAQIGVLKALEEEGIPVDCIAGTSMGAIIGGLYSCGYTPDELEDIAISLPWQSILSLKDTYPRSSIFLEQQKIRDRATIAIRFNKLKLVVPKLLSSSQTLTGALDLLVLNSLYHPEQQFSTLPVNFRAVATDLVTGKRITLTSGSLSEAMLASSTIPILFEPIKRDGYELVDGGLVANLPVDELEAFNASCKIAVDTHGGMYAKIEEIDSPWKAADQAMTILTGLQYPAQLAKADIVITPDLSAHKATDFSDFTTLVQNGYQKGKLLSGTIKRAIQSVEKKGTPLHHFRKTITITGDEEARPEYSGIVTGIMHNSSSLEQTLQKLLETDLFSRVYARLDKPGKKVDIHLDPLPRIKQIVISGGPEPGVTDSEQATCFKPVTSCIYTNSAGTRALEELVRMYRRKGFSLVALKACTYNGNTLQIELTSGKASDIEIRQDKQTTSLVPITREIKMNTGKAVQLAHAEESVDNLYGTGAFSRVAIAAGQASSDTKEKKTVLQFSLNNKPSSVLRLGVRYDETENAQFLVDYRNENVGGTTGSLGGWIKAGKKNSMASFEYTIPRIGSTHFTLFSKLFFDQREFETRDLHFSKDFSGFSSETGSSYGIQRYGITSAFGTRIRKNGLFVFDVTLQNAQSYQDSDNTGIFRTDNLNMLSLGMQFTIDSRNNSLIPSEGRYTNLRYAVTPPILDADETYWQLSGTHEENIPLSSTTTLQLSGMFGLSSSSMPLSEKFYLGGQGNLYSRRFIGLKQNDLIGNNMAAAGVQLRYTPSFEILFPASFLLHYSIGNAWERRDQISFARLIQGIGAGLMWDTPIGPARLTVSKAFAFLPYEDSNQTSSLRFSDTILYFSLGHDF